jgi:hypothetical protein
MVDEGHAQRTEAMLILEDGRRGNGGAPVDTVVEVREVAELSDDGDVHGPHLVRVPGAALELQVHALGCCCLIRHGLPPPPPLAKGWPSLLITLLVQLRRGLSSSIDVKTALAAKASRGAVGAELVSGLMGIQSPLEMTIFKSPQVKLTETH